MVVPVFHLGAQLTGHLRARGLLSVPSVVLVVDFEVHRQWLHPGNDRLLCLTREAAREARAGTGTVTEVCGPVVAPEFFADAPGADGWRSLFGRLGPGLPAVVLSAGAWGVGSHLDGTVRLLAGNGFLPVVLCGDNERLRRDLSAVPGVLALGWVTDMPGLLHAARALVDNAAGQTAVQALAAGLPVVGHRPIPGHGAQGVRRMAALGVSEVARTTPLCSASCGGSPPRGRPAGADRRRARAVHGRRARPDTRRRRRRARPRREPTPGP